MNWIVYVWLGLMLVFLHIETTTVSVVSVWFACGSLAAAIAGACNGPIWLQLLLFFGVSCVLLACLRPLAKKYFTPKITPTNVDSVIGMQGLVLQDINNVEGTGQVKLSGMEWSARSSTGENICAGTLIQVDKVEGVKVFVTVVKAAEAQEI